MVDYNKLLVLPCDNGLFIDVSVEDLPYYTNVYLDKIVIDNQKTFTVDGISSTPIYEYTVSGNQKQLQLTVKPGDFTEIQGAGTLFFVYVIVKGTPAKDTPCGMDNATSVKAVVDTYPVYKAGLKFIKEAYAACEVPRSFIDFILRFKAFTMCLETEDYPLAINYWEKFYKGLKRPVPNCGCYGRDTV